MRTCGGTSIDEIGAIRAGAGRLTGRGSSRNHKEGRRKGAVGEGCAFREEGPVRGKEALRAKDAVRGQGSAGGKGSVRAKDAVRERGSAGGKGFVRWRYIIGAVLFLKAGFAGGTPPAALARNLSGEIQGTLPAGLYRVTGNLVVAAGHTLTISPGVVLEFDNSIWSDYAFDARGALFADGTAEAPIVLRPAPGVPEFNYLRIADGTSRLRHCRIERAGRVSGLDEGGLWIDNCSPLVQDCHVVDGRWIGIFVTGSGARPFVTRTHVSGCAAAGIAADLGAGIRLENCISIRNSADGISLSDGMNTLVGCLVADNGKNGIDCRGSDELHATLVNCTVAGNRGTDLPQVSHFALYNCLATSRPTAWDAAEHTYAIANEPFLGFADPNEGDFRLSGSSPGRDAGTRFGVPGALLPATDLNGNPRINGIVDLGAYESDLAPDAGESGPFFSPALLRPRMTLPEFRVPRSVFPILVAAIGTFPRTMVTAELLPEGGPGVLLPVTSVVGRDLEPGSSLAVQLYPIGIERVQEITVYVPAGAPEGLHGIRVRLGDRVYESPQAVRIHSAWPQRWGLLHVTDTHVGFDAETQTAAARLRLLVREANFLQPELVAITGDLCENGNLENAAWTDSLLTILRGLRVPVFVLPGNHERYNEDGAYNPLGYFRHFHSVNRFANAEVAVGGARIYGLDSGPELGITELYRCLGPTDAALDWVESRLSNLDPQADRPRFLLTHGPAYDYFSWNGQNTARMRDLATAQGISLCLAGHTHRFETYRNQGANWLGRNDYAHGDDWGQDVPFPGYPLHLQTSSLGKEEHLPMPLTGAPAPARDRELTGPGAAAEGPALPDTLPAPPEISRRGILGDDIGFRWIEVEGKEVSFFSADSDSDGWRSTESAWILGDIAFNTSTAPDGTITSCVTNRHFETWRRPHHFVPALPGVPYLISGGTFIHRWTDGTIEVEVDSTGPGGISVVTLFPNHPSGAEEVTGGGDELRVLGNPFIGSVRFQARLQPSRGAGPAEPGAITVFDPAGRRVRLLPRPPGAGDALDNPANELLVGPNATRTAWEVLWDGRDEMGRDAPPGVYFARLERSGGPARVVRVIKLR